MKDNYVKPGHSHKVGEGRPFARRRIAGTVGMGVCAALMLSACQSKDAKVDPLAGGGGLTGSWVSADNVFTAQMNNGRFISVANDTGETLSEGSYYVVSASEVQLNWTGKLSQQANSARCQREGEALMNCTDQAGRTFTLRKTSNLVS